MLLRESLPKLNCSSLEVERKLKCCNKPNIVSRKKNAYLKLVISELKRKSLLSEQSIDVLERCDEGVSEVLKGKGAKESNASSHYKYPPALRRFALTLNFYSSCVNRFVRQTFDTCLPHPRTLEKWRASVEVKPGFTEHEFAALETKVNAAGGQKKKGCFHPG